MSDDAPSASLRLFPPSTLPPFLGPDRASLHSLFRQICEVNQLLVNDVVSEFSVPLYGADPKRSRQLVKAVNLIDSGSIQSARLIRFLEAATGLSGLESLTLRDLSSLKGVAPLTSRPFRQWCRYCYQSDVQAGVIPYDRLIWSIGLVRYCPTHETPLASTCLSCGKDRTPTLYGRDVSGFCPRCLAWLGEHVTPWKAAKDDLARHGVWVARSFADLLSAPPPAEVCVLEGIQKSIRQLADQHHDGAYSRLANRIRRNKSVVATWLTGRAKPNWDALCDLSFAYQQPMHQVLRGEVDWIALQEPHLLPSAIQPRHGYSRKRPKSRDAAEVAQFLQSVAGGGYKSMTSVRDAARHLGVDVRELYRVAPDEAKAAAAAFESLRAAARAAAAAARAQSLETTAAAVAERFLKANAKVTRRAMEQEMGQLGWRPRRHESTRLLALVRNTVMSLEGDAQIVCTPPSSGKT